MLLLNGIKDDIGKKQSMLHSATIWCNGVMNAYTTNDAFLRDNLQWATSATNWNRFSATASLGMVHIGNQSKADEILNPYLAGSAEGGVPSSPYSTAGAYYAYGLIHANSFSEDTCNFFMDGYRNSG